MHKTIEKDGKKMVHLNVGKDYYVLLHDWPLSTVWNLNGSLDPVMNQVYGRGYVSMEVFTKEPENATTMLGADGLTFEECEEKCWEKYQQYQKCQHEFTRESPGGCHYTNGAGFCKHCGMLKSQAFEPETICTACHKHANLFSTLNDEWLCEDCYQNRSWQEKEQCVYFSEETLLDFVKRLGTLESIQFQKMNDKVMTIRVLFQKEKKRYTMYMRLQEDCSGYGYWVEYYNANFITLRDYPFRSNALGTHVFIQDKDKEVLLQKKKKLNEKLEQEVLEWKKRPYKEEIQNINKIIGK